MAEKPLVILITATRLSRDQFAAAPLSYSLQRLRFDGAVGLHLAADNRDGLPKVYNRFIDEDHRNHILAFVHDDVWLDDVFFADRLRAALDAFDVVGLAGNTVLLPDAPAWHVKNNHMDWDHGHLSGTVCHGPQPFGAPSHYGPAPAPVQLLDGLLLAVRGATLLDSGLRFDERFDFHFYDLDFSRQANALGLKVGTWPIAVTHASGGTFGSPGWQAGLALYREKWGNR